MDSASSRPADWGDRCRRRSSRRSVREDASATFYTMGLMQIPDAVAALERDLRGIFGTRLRSLVVYGLRACEVQARGHWLHLREGYLETRGRGDGLAMLIVESAPAFAALVTSVAQLDSAVAPADVAAAARQIERHLSLPSTASDIVALAG